MGKVDEIKEDIGWLKVWLGIAVAAAFGMLGWLVSHYKESELLLLMLDGLGVLILAGLITWINHRALQKIRSLRDLKKDD